MATLVAFLRGINVGRNNRIPMAELRTLLAAAGFEDVRTYLQSGNVVLARDSTAATVARELERLVADRFGLEIPVVVRTRAELAKVVRANPLGSVATDPKRYLVSFVAEKLDAGARRKLEAATAEPEQLVVRGRELYSWHPDTIARSKLWALLAGRSLGVTTTARNWSTVTKLLELADG
jgi:uncharacterized protein (DUF1697 family)